jgi:hypothetical protein
LNSSYRRECGTYPPAVGDLWRRQAPDRYAQDIKSGR